MLRPVATEIALFLLPFVIYAVFLWATRTKLLRLEAWPLPRVIWLTIVALLLVATSFVVLTEYSGAPPGSTYIPAHIENGRFVPGTMRH